jgi:hypothetical protein
MRGSELGVAMTRRVVICRALVLAALSCSTITVGANAQGSGNQAGLISSGQTATLDCAGGKGEIMGSNNTLTPPRSALSARAMPSPGAASTANRLR